MFNGFVIVIGLLATATRFVPCTWLAAMETAFPCIVTGRVIGFVITSSIKLASAARLPSILRLFTPKKIYGIFLPKITANLSECKMRVLEVMMLD